MTELDSSSDAIVLHCSFSFPPQIQVMHQQLVFFNESLVRCCGGSLSSTDHLVKEMREKLEGVSRDGSEWLEDGHGADSRN